MKHIRLFLCLALFLTIFSCTKLNEKFRSELDQNNTASITASELLINAYNSIAGTFQGNGNLWSSATITSDEAIGPTRAGDWDDNGLWRSLHLHSWNADHSYLSGAYNSLLGAQFAASNVLQFNPSTQQAAEARFLRALSMYWVLDGYDQVPYREDLTDYKKLPVTLKGLEVVDFIVAELNAIMGDLPDNGPSGATVANKNAARALLMKVYLNKGVFANRAAPTFDGGDMDQVISLADQIINSGKYTLNDNFFDIFAPDNDIKSSESIYTFLKYWHICPRIGRYARFYIYGVSLQYESLQAGMGFQRFPLFTISLKQLINDWVVIIRIRTGFQIRGTGQMLDFLSVNNII
jgi:hypothetical protein